MRYHAVQLPFIVTFSLTLVLSCPAFGHLDLGKTPGDKTQPNGGALAGERHRVDGHRRTDPDNDRALVHLLLYADVLDIEGLIASPPHSGRLKLI